MKKGDRPLLEEKSRNNLASPNQRGGEKGWGAVSKRKQEADLKGIKVRLTREGNHCIDGGGERGF